MAVRALIDSMAAIVALLIIAGILSFLIVFMSYSNQVNPLSTNIPYVRQYINIDSTGIHYFNMLLTVAMIALVIYVIFSGFRLVNSK